MYCTVLPPQDDSSAPAEGGEEEAGGSTAGDAAAEGVTDTDFNRAQRFKRLYRLLSSSAVGVVWLTGGWYELVLV